MKGFANSKKMFSILLFAICFLFFNSFAVLSIITSSASYVANSTYYGSNTVSVDNGDFTKFTKGNDGVPYSILSNSWESISGLSSETVSTGVINVGADDFNSKTNGGFGLAQNPKTDTDINSADNYILMIRAKQNETKYGYKSNEIKLTNSKFYKISVHCKTGLLNKSGQIIEEGFGSIYTTISNKTSENFTNIYTGGHWKTYDFYVATDTFDSTSFKIELRLGNKTSVSGGVVFFDHIEILEIANIDFFSKSVNSNESVLINLDNDYIEGFENSDFENGLAGWQVENNISNTIAGASVKENADINQTIMELKNSNAFKSYTLNNVYQNTKSLFISNVDASQTTVTSTKTNFVPIIQHGYYRLSVLVKTGNISQGGLDISLIQLADKKNEPIKVSQTGITSDSGGLSSYNDFREVVFYIRGHSWYDSSISISFELGSSSQKVSGYAIVDNIKIQKISQTEYSNNSSSNNALDLAKNILNTSTFLNGSFDFVDSIDSNISYPANPANWTYSNSDENVLESGIIRVRDEYFANDCTNYGLSSSNNPGPNTSYAGLITTVTSSNTYENVLMLKNTSNNDVFFTSKETTLSSNTSSSSTIISVEVAVKTLSNSVAFLKIVDADKNPLGIIDNIKAKDWTNFTFFIKNGISSQSIKIVLGTHSNSEKKAYSFFDFVKYSSSVTKTKSEILSTENSQYIDLMQDSFYMPTSINSSTYQVPNFTEYSVENNKKSSLFNQIVDASSIMTLKTREEAEDSNVMLIANSVASYQILQTVYTYFLKANSYYEISVFIKTDLAYYNDKNSGAYFEILTVKTDETEEDTENKNKFNNIIVSENDNNGWKKYSIFVMAESDYSIKILLGLGTKENMAVGEAYFDDLKVVDITKSDYASYKQDESTIVTSVVEKETSEKSDSAASVSKDSDINLWALSSSIILALALIFAIAGYLIRRIPKRQIAKISQSSYKKSPYTVDTDAVRQELKLAREKHEFNLKTQLNNLEGDYETLQKSYEEETSKELNADLKEKMYIKHTKQINKLSKEIEYIKSALKYLSDSSNIRAQEEKEIKKRKKQIQEEFLKLKTETEKENVDNKDLKTKK